MAEQAGEADGMEAARTQFEQWRGSRSGKAPIPDELWRLAINAARQQGVNRAAQQLRLDAGKLKRLLVAAKPQRTKTRRRPKFVELIAPATAASPECVIRFSWKWRSRSPNTVKERMREEATEPTRRKRRLPS